MRSDISKVIDSEVDHAKQLWESLPREQRPLKDADKPVEFWLMHIRRYLRQAEDGCYNTDKTPALEAVRKISALCVRCMENNTTPERK